MRRPSHPPLAPAPIAVLFAFAFALAPRVAAAQSAADLAGTYRVTADRTTVQVPEWGADCRSRPESHSGATGRQVTVSADGGTLVFSGGRTRRTDACWSENPGVRRISSSRTGNRWSIICQTPDSDYQRERGEYVITAASADRITYTETTEYSWQLRGSRCRASATRNVSYERVGQAPTPVAVVDASVPTTPPPARCASPGAAARLEVIPARRSLAPGGRGCFRARALDANRCEVLPAAGAAIAWQMTRAQGAAGGSDAVMENGCVRAPSGSPVAEYEITASAGALNGRAIAAVVSAEDYRSLVAQRIEDTDAGVAAPTAPAAPLPGGGVGAVERAPPPEAAPPRSGPPTLVLLLVGAGVLLAIGGFALLRRRAKPERAPVSEPPGFGAVPVDARGIDPSSVSGRQRRDAVPISARELPFAAGVVAPASWRDAPVAAAAKPAPSSAVAGVAAPAERPLVRRCTKCNGRFTAEIAFCPEDGVATVEVAAGDVPAPVRTAGAPIGAPGASVDAFEPTVDVRLANQAVPVPICPKCSAPVTGGAMFCPNDGTPVARDALPMSCPKCGKRFGLGTAFCGEDGTPLA